MTGLKKVADNPARPNQHKVNSESEYEKFEQMLEQMKVPQDQHPLWKEILLKPFPTKDKHGHSSRPQFRCHPNLMRLTATTLSKLPASLKQTPSDACRAGLIRWNLDMLYVFDDEDEKKEQMNALEALMEFEYLLDDVEMKENIRRMKNRIDNLESFNGALKDKAKSILDKIEKTLIDKRPNIEDLSSEA